ncbi:acyl-CoA dehydrogenase family protein [Nocardia rhamnosiphila]|uniref:Acyl-CoA dehydrogenase family protein n=1 Tax=Nocardia rhamnosiphila TaxID=426716 RepID=A0ABV2WRC9_9NOCA
MRDRVDALMETRQAANWTDREFLAARFDAGLAWVHYPEGSGGLNLSPDLQPLVEQLLIEAGAPVAAVTRNYIGLGMAAPTLLRHATTKQRERWLKPLWTGEEVWCQLFSEPGAGSDLANVGASARRDGTDWVVNGQKVWTSLAHLSRWALLVARTDPQQPKHRGLTYFVCDMEAPGVDVRPLRQATGEAEFNEVFLTDVRVPDANRLDEVGQGWAVTQTTLMSERVAIGGAVAPREAGVIQPLVKAWRADRAVRERGSLDDLMRLWVDAEALRITSARLSEQVAAGGPGPEGSGVKLAYSRLAQEAGSMLLDLLGPEALRYDNWELRRPDPAETENRVPGFGYVRTRAYSIEGGTSEIMRTIISERVLKMPAEPGADRNTPWKDLPR